MMVFEKGAVKIWRVYNNGSVKDETHVLWPHREGTGYGGDVKKWSDHNRVERFGCAQVMQKTSEPPIILYEGYLNKERLDPIVKALVVKDQPNDQ